MMADQLGQEPDQERQHQKGRSAIKRVFRRPGDALRSQERVRPDQREGEGETKYRQLQTIKGEDLPNRN